MRIPNPFRRHEPQPDHHVDRHQDVELALAMLTDRVKDLEARAQTIEAIVNVETARKDD